MLDRALNDTLQNAINRLLEFDPDTRERLRSLAGTVACVQLEGLERRMFVELDGDQVHLAEHSESPPDIVLKGTPLAFVRFAMDRESGALGSIKIEGDAGLAQQFVKIFKRLDIDWEECLSRYVGDVAARQLSRAGTALRDWAGEAARNVRADITEYLQEESRLLAPRVRVARFLSEVDELRADVERLALRVARLKQRVQ